MADVMARMKSRVAGRGARIALPEADDERMILAAKTIIAEDLARVVLVGKPDVIRALAARHGLALDDVEIVDVEDDEVRRRCADLYYERRKDRGVTAEEAWEVMADPLFAAAAMVGLGDVDGMVAGAVNSTPQVLRASLRCIGVAPDVDTVSSCFIMTTRVPEFGVDGALIYSDCGVVPQPNEDQLADIVISAAESCEAYLEVEPRVAMLSFSTHGSAEHPDVTKVVTALRMVQRRAPELLVTGSCRWTRHWCSAWPRAGARQPDRGARQRAHLPDLDAGNTPIRLAVDRWRRCFRLCCKGWRSPPYPSRAPRPTISSTTAVCAPRAGPQNGTIERWR